MVYNRLVIRVPSNARGNEPKLGFSYRSVEEHIALVNQFNIEKVLLVCDNLKFLHKCPNISDMQIYPSYDAGESFDYSPLYDMEHLRQISCRTVYGDCNQFKTFIDFSKIPTLESIAVEERGHIGYEKVNSLQVLWMSNNKSCKNCENISNSIKLQELTLFQCGIQSLKGIEKHPELRSITLYNNRSLYDISQLEYIAPSLVELVVDGCAQIKDFTVLEKLPNIEYLQLTGSNSIPNLSFLSTMKKLKVLNFTVNVLDGDLSSCMEIPYATCKNRRHYNYKDSQLPKVLIANNK